MMLAALMLWRFSGARAVAWCSIGSTSKSESTLQCAKRAHYSPHQTLPILVRREAGEFCYRSWLQRRFCCSSALSFQQITGLACKGIGLSSYFCKPGRRCCHTVHRCIVRCAQGAHAVAGGGRPVFPHSKFIGSSRTAAKGCLILQKSQLDAAGR